MSTSKKHYSPMQWIHISITLLLMFGFGHLPTFASVTPVGMKILGIFLGVIYGYSTCEVIWPSLFAFIAFGTSGYAASFNAAIASMMGSGTVFQIITQYFTAGAIIIYGFGKWFVRWSLSQKAFQGKPLFYTWCFMFVFMWSAIVVSQIPMGLLLYAIWADIADSCGYSKDSTFRYYGFGGILLSLLSLLLSPRFAGGVSYFTRYLVLTYPLLYALWVSSWQGRGRKGLLLAILGGVPLVLPGLLTPYMLGVLLLLLTGFALLLAAARMDWFGIGRLRTALPVLWTALAGLAALCLHETLGGWQFGARYTVDLIPYVLLAEAWAADGPPRPVRDWEWFLCAAAVLFNAYGAVYMLSH